MKKDILIELGCQEDTWIQKLLSPVYWLRACMAERREQRRYRRQRARKGYSDYDICDMRDWFVRTMRPMLLELNAKTYTYPEEAGEEQWSQILQEMAELLEVMDVWEDGPARLRAGLTPEDKGPEATQRISEEKGKAKERFFFLFNKWFYDLGY